MVRLLAAIGVVALALLLLGSSVQTSRSLQDVTICDGGPPGTCNQFAACLDTTAGAGAGRVCYCMATDTWRCATTAAP